MATSLTAKLQLKTGRTMRVLNAPQGYADRLARELEGVELVGKGKAEAVLHSIHCTCPCSNFSPSPWAPWPHVGYWELRPALRSLRWLASYMSWV